MKCCNLIMKVGLSLAAAVLSLACFSLQAFAAWDDWHSGYATYTGSGYSGGNALLDPIPDDMEITALNPYDYNSYGVDSSLAGAYLEVKGSKGSTVVYVTDKYPEGADGALDLCPISFGKIGDMLAGKIDISWRVTEAPISGNFSYRIKEGSSQYWAAIQVRNHKFPVLKMEYYKDGKWNEMTKMPYNHFMATDMGPDPLQLRITDICGHVVTDNIPALPDGKEPAYIIPGNVQFPSSADVKFGDINGDGKINSLDCTVLKRYILSDETSINKKASDLDGDGKINSKDYALLKNYILLKIDRFPVEK